MERQTARYESLLSELAEHAELQAFAGAAGYYAHQRLLALVARLRAVYDLYELEGDVVPVREAIDAYHADLRDHQLRPDPSVSGVLARFLEDLTPRLPVLQVETRIAQPSVVGRWPEGLLAVSPEELQALHEVLQDRAPERSSS